MTAFIDALRIRPLGCMALVLIAAILVVGASAPARAAPTVPAISPAHPLDLRQGLFFAAFGRAHTASNQVIVLNTPMEHAYWSAVDPKTGAVMGGGWYNITTGPVPPAKPNPAGRIPLFGSPSPLTTEAGTYEIERFVRFTPWGPCRAPTPGCRETDARPDNPTLERLGGLLEFRIRMKGVLKNGVHVTRHATLLVGAPGEHSPPDAFAGVKVLIDDGLQFSLNGTMKDGRIVEGKFGTDSVSARGVKIPLGDGVAYIVRVRDTPLLAHLRGKARSDRRAMRIATVDDWYDLQSALLALSSDEGRAAESLTLSRAQPAPYAKRPLTEEKPVKLSGMVPYSDPAKIVRRIPGEIPAVGPDNWWFSFYGVSWTKEVGGKSIVFNQQHPHAISSIFNTKTGEIHGGGWYYMRDENGQVTEMGVWSALDIQAFDSWGPNFAAPMTEANRNRDPGAPLNPYGPAGNLQPKVLDAGQNALGDVYAGVVHEGVDPIRETSKSHGGLVTFRVEMRGVKIKDGAKTVRVTTFYESCVDGLPPIWAYEGTKSPAIDGDAYMVNKTVDANGRRTAAYGPYPAEGFTGNNQLQNTPLYAHLVGKAYEPANDAYLNIRTIEDWRLAHTVRTGAADPARGNFAFVAGDRHIYPPKLAAAAAKTLGLPQDDFPTEFYCPPPAAPDTPPPASSPAPR